MIESETCRLVAFCFRDTHWTTRQKSIYCQHWVIGPWEGWAGEWIYFEYTSSWRSTPSNSQSRLSSKTSFISNRLRCYLYPWGCCLFRSFGLGSPGFLPIILSGRPIGRILPNYCTGYSRQIIKWPLIGCTISPTTFITGIYRLGVSFMFINRKGFQDLPSPWWQGLLRRNP